MLRLLYLNRIKIIMPKLRISYLNRIKIIMPELRLSYLNRIKVIMPKLFDFCSQLHCGDGEYDQLHYFTLSSTRLAGYPGVNSLCIRNVILSPASTRSELTLNRFWSKLLLLTHPSINTAATTCQEITLLQLTLQLFYIKRLYVCISGC